MPNISPEPYHRSQLSKNEKLDYLSADLKPTVMIQMDITDIQFENYWFDAVICNHVLEHITDDRKAIFHNFTLYEWILKTGLCLNL